MLSRKSDQSPIRFGLLVEGSTSGPGREAQNQSPQHRGYEWTQNQKTQNSQHYDLSATYPDFDPVSAIAIDLCVTHVYSQDLSKSLATPVRSKLRKRYSDAKVYRCLRRDRSVLPIGHPLPGNKQAHWRQSRSNERSAYPDAEWQHRRRMSTPGKCPSSLRGA